MEEEICTLERIIDEKQERIQSLEESILSMDDILRQEKDIGYQMLKTENKIKSIVSAGSPDVLKNIVRMTEMFEHYINEMQSNYSDQVLLQNFVFIQQGLAELEEYISADVEPTSETINMVKNKLESLSKEVSDENNNPTRFAEKGTGNFFFSYRKMFWVFVKDVNVKSKAISTFL